MVQLPLVGQTDERKVSHLFDTYVCIGDEITIERAGQKYVARIEHDTDTSVDDFDLDYSDDVVKAWRADEWHFVGVVVEMVCAHCGEVSHTGGASLWGIESNLPGEERACSNYLSQVAHELTHELTT